ncbi:hypothetical protein [Paenibacillus sp. GCM10023250]|uniref:hypothetical protein n=1 Tax=Paenibacillus sp. GCM10023250 TaxID=3252648 RepID=UPI0036197E3D
MNTRWMLVGSMLALSLLTACGNATKAGHADHGASHQATSAATPTGSSSGHGGHGRHGTDQPAEANNLQASFTFASGPAKANERTEMDIQITGQDGKPVMEFELNREKLLHLIIVNHEFAIETSFPTGGDYKVIADFIPKGGSSVTRSEWVKVEGTEGVHADIKADAKLEKIVDGKEVELSLSGTKPAEEVTLTFNILDARTKEGIRNLEPYLGAVGHVVILSADAEQYLHVHPVNETATGPKAEFATSFPKSGTYKIWGQFQHQRNVFTVPFVVEIQ